MRSASFVTGGGVEHTRTRGPGVVSLSYSDRYVLVVSLPFRGVSCSVPCFPLLNSAFFWKGSRRVAQFSGVLGPTLGLGQHLVPPQRCESDAYNATDYDILSPFIHLRHCKQCGPAVHWFSRDYGFHYDYSRRYALHQHINDRYRCAIATLRCARSHRRM